MAKTTNPRHKQISKKKIHNGLPVMKSNKLNKGVSVPLVERLQLWLDFVVQKYSKSRFVRFDLHFPSVSRGAAYPDDNIPLSNFLNVLRRGLQRNKAYQPIRTDYFWVREQDSSVHHHYHIVLVLDGNIVKEGWHLRERLEEVWEWQLNLSRGEGAGLVHIPPMQVDLIIRSHYQSDSPNPHYYDTLHKTLTYLTKIHSKERTPKGYNEFGHSRIQDLKRHSLPDVFSPEEFDFLDDLNDY
jgi:hypothetical protein